MSLLWYPTYWNHPEKSSDFLTCYYIIYHLIFKGVSTYFFKIIQKIFYLNFGTELPRQYGQS